MSKKYFTIYLDGQPLTRSEAIELIDGNRYKNVYVHIIEVFDDGFFKVELSLLPIPLVIATIRGQQQNFWKTCKESICYDFIELSEMPEQNCLFKILDKYRLNQFIN